MGDEEKQAVGKLNFNAPLLSTRRPIGMNTLEILSYANSKRASWDFCDRVPFSWEKTPGKPKDTEARRAQIVDLPPPKPPPGRWLQTNQATCDDNIDQYCDYDDGCDGDVEDDGDDRNEDSCHDAFSDAIDLFSLAQSVDMDETRAEVEALGTRNLKAEGYGGSHSPNYIIQRFLPDAKALAASSVLDLSKSTSERLPDSGDCRRTSISRAVSLRQSYCSTKGCGLGFFFPWRLKPKPCGAKSPVLAAAFREKLQRTRRENEN